MPFRRCLAAVAVATLSMACGSSGPANPAGPSSSPAPVPSPTPTPTPTPARGPLNGRYELRFEADSACTNLPESARVRRYTANFDGSFGATLTGAQFGPAFGQVTWDWVYGSIGTSTNGLLLFQDPEIWELLTPDSYVSIFGDAQGAIDPNHTELVAWGDFKFCPAREDEPYPECAVPEIVCRSDRHKMTLTRQ